jgi:hypothetical protein
VKRFLRRFTIHRVALAGAHGDDLCSHSLHAQARPINASLEEKLWQITMIRTR